jgi:hypothetical protein
VHNFDAIHSRPVPGVQLAFRLARTEASKHDERFREPDIEEVPVIRAFPAPLKTFSTAGGHVLQRATWRRGLLPGAAAQAADQGASSAPPSPAMNAYQHVAT